MSETWERVADLELEIDEYALEGLELRFSEEFVRKTTVIRLRGGGVEGVGEDVVYAASNQENQQRRGPVLPLAGRYTLADFSAHLATLELFTDEPEMDVFPLYRTWAFESAALDLALRQAGTTLAERVGRTPRPLTFVSSLRLGEPPSVDPVLRRRAIAPGLRFKLDATPSWDDALFAALVELDAVDSVDMKGQYKGTIVDQPPDPELYQRVLDAFPQAWIEDPHTTPEIDALLEPHRDRVTWDAPIHSIADIEALPHRPRMVNLKPSRLGGVRSLFDAYDYCAQHGIGAYGGGQTELGPGRGQIQYLASLFHPDTPNDVAPSGYNLPDPPADLPGSPLAAATSATGFRWDGS
jgi:L-alanine-DL-glutamate epimerase-like enolase superfamily enzyme